MLVWKGHTHSLQVGVLGTVQPYWSQLLAVAKWAHTIPKGNSTAKDPPTIIPKAPKDRVLTAALFITQNPEATYEYLQTKGYHVVSKKNEVEQL